MTRRRIPDRYQAEALQRKADRALRAPIALAALDKDEQSAYRLLSGLSISYIDALLSGRLDVWARAAHGIVELLADPLVKVHKRGEK